MSLSPTVVKCLTDLKKHGAAERVYRTGRAGDWTWRIAGQPSPSVCKALLKGYAVCVGADRNRAVLTDRGRRLAA